MWWRFIGGSTIRAASTKLRDTPFHPIFDYAKEAAGSYAEAVAYSRKIISDSALVYPLGATFALKLSSFHGDQFLIDDTIAAMKAYGVKRILLDAESNAEYTHEQDVYDKLVEKHNTTSPFLYKTYQMYRRDAFIKLVEDIEKHPRLGIKLVRGAYLHQDQHSGVLLPTKHQVDEAYDRTLHSLLTCFVAPGRLEVMIASHNNKSLYLAKQIALSKPSIQPAVSFAQLLGMNDFASNTLAQEHKLRVFKYVPYGSFTETYPYLIRRLYENYGVLKYI